MKRSIVFAFALIISLVPVGTTATFAQESASKEEATQNLKQAEDVVKEKIDVNSATLEELQTLNGIGPKLAQAIIDDRPYADIKELLEIKGIGEKKLKKIEDSIEAGPMKKTKSQEVSEQPEQKKEGKKKPKS